MRSVLQVFGCVWIACTLASAAEVRIAIVPLNDLARPAGDVLTAGLGTATNITLIERDFLDRAIRERSFSATQQGDISALGKALHADGLVFLEGSAPTSQEPKETSIRGGLGLPITATESPGRLTLRLIAVSSGVVLDAATYPHPLPDPARWATLVSTRIARLSPKLQVSREQTIPISILNLHSAVATPSSAESERALGTLLLHRLAAEPEVFVLERKELGRAEWEKLIASDEREFWSGGYLLQGVTDRDGAQRSTITVNAQLTRPDGTRVEVDADGPRNNLAQLAETLSRRILETVRVQNQKTQWDPVGEARQFEEEAIWALRWSMWPEAYAAAQSAWALGSRTQPVASARLKALMQQTHPDDVWFVDHKKNIRFSNMSRKFEPLRSISWTTNPAEPMDVTLAIEAAGSWQAINQSEGAAWSQDKAWLELGSAVLTNTSAIIRHQYLYGWRSNVFHPDLAILRQLCRDLCAALPIESARPLLLKQGAFWQERPVDAMAMLRQTWAHDPASYAAGIVRDPYEPFWVGWSPRDRELGVKQWAGFISELQSSTNRQDRAFGSMLKVATERFDPQIAMAHEEFLDATMDEKHSRFSTEIDFPVLDAFSNLLTNRYSSPVTLRRTRLLNQWKSLDFGRVKHYLQIARTHDVGRGAGWRLTERFFSQEEARELLPIVDDSIKRVGGDWMQAVRGHLVELSSKATDERERLLADPVFDPVRFRRLFVEQEFTEAEAQRFAMPLRFYANRMNWSNELGKVDARLQAIVASANARSKTNAPASPKPREALRITRQLRPLYRDQRGESLPTRLGPWLEHQGKIITVINHPQKEFSWPEPGDGAHVAILDPITGTCQMLPQVITVERYQPLSFRVMRNQFYWISGQSSLSTFSLDSTAAPRELKLNLPLSWAELTVLQDRLFLTTKDYIAEFLTHDGSLKLLASKRRKPAANQLDDWAGWTASPRLWLTEGTLFANVGGTNVWKLSSTGPWSLREADTGHQRFPFSLSYVANFTQCFDERVWIDGCREVLLSPELTQLPYWPMPLDYPLTPGRSSGGSTTHAFDGTNLWVLLPPKQLQGNVEGVGLTLLWFQPDYEMPAQLPLVFAQGNAFVRRLGLLCIPIQSGLVFGFSAPITERLTIFENDEPAWFVPFSQLADWVTPRQPLTRRLARNQPERRQFDLNKDGRLDADELRAMQTNSAWMDKRERFEAERMLLTFDADRDSKLDSEEWEALKAASTELSFKVPNASPFARWGAPTPTGSELLKQHDQDADCHLSHEELRAYYRKLSSPALASSPSGRPTRPEGRSLGLLHSRAEAGIAALLARHDKNKNGKLDPQEKHEMQPPHIRPFDKDTNGILSSAEFEEYRKSASARRNAGKQQRPGASTSSRGVMGK